MSKVSPKQSSKVTADAMATSVSILDPEIERERQVAISAYREQVVSFLQQSLVQYQDRSNHLIKEVDELRHEAKKKEHGVVEMVGYLQKEIKRTERDSREVRRKLKSFLEFERQRIEKIETQCNSAMVEKEKEYAAREEVLKEQAAARNNELIELRKFREDKNALEEGLLKSKLEIEEHIRQHELQTAKIEQSYRLQIETIRAEYQATISKMNKTSKEDAERNLSIEGKLLREQNVNLHSQLQFHEKETAKMLTENEQLKSKVKELRRELELYQDRDIHFARRGVKQRTDVIEAKARVRALESDALIQMETLQAELELFKREHLEEMATTRSEAANLRRLVKLKDKELHRLKVLARVIVTQRSELEEFFHLALDEVKTEVRAQQNEKMAEVKAAWKSSRMDLLARVGVPTSQQLQEELAQLRWRISQKVELDDLSAIQRERVLKLLFAKMNQKQRQKVAPTLGPQLPHSFAQLTPDEIPPAYTPGLTFVTEQGCEPKVDD